MENLQKANRKHCSLIDFCCFDHCSDVLVFIKTDEGTAFAQQPVWPFWKNKIRPSEAVQEITALTGCLHGKDAGQPYLSASSSSEGAAVLTLLFMTAIAKPGDTHLAHLVHSGGCA